MQTHHGFIIAFEHQCDAICKNGENIEVKEITHWNYIVRDQYGSDSLTDIFADLVDSLVDLTCEMNLCHVTVAYRSIWDDGDTVSVTLNAELDDVLEVVFAS